MSYPFLSFFQWIPCFLLLCALASVPLASAVQAEDDYEGAIRELLTEAVPRPRNPARHTFIFWINGDADHFVTAMATPTVRQNDESKVYRADKFDEERVERVASLCTACNVVILHDQRGSAHWYTSNQPWASYLRIFSRGHKLLERHVNEVNETDPRVLAELLKAAERAFPGTSMHLIYRGHSFRKPYQPGSKEILPFDYSYPGQAYGQAVFLNSLDLAGYGLASAAPLASITFASCSMASFEIADMLTRGWRDRPAPLAKYLIASEVDVLETLNVGFRFESLAQVTDVMDDRQVSYLLASRLLEAFRNTSTVADAMMEYPVTWMDLSQMREIEMQWLLLAKAIHQLAPEARAEFYGEATKRAGLVKTVSDRYINSLKASGKSQAVVDIFTSRLRSASPYPGDMDLGLLLNLIETSELTRPLAEDARGLRDLLSRQVFVLDRPVVSDKLGLSISLIKTRKTGETALPGVY